MKQVTIETMQSPYTITIGDNALESIPEMLRGEKCVVVTDERVAGYHLNRLLPLLPKHQVVVLPEGEPTKCQQNLSRLYDVFADFGLTRSDTVLGFGGGVIGDLTGFAAGTYMRGVPYLAVPTTLLAMVDSSVGGKVAVNHPAGKNMIGMFYQPSAVVADTSLLSTLDDRQLACGMAEVIKYALIADRDFYAQLQHSENTCLVDLIERCVKIKEMYVREDTFDRGRRMMLNFGHTIGHCVENGLGYGVVLHGEGVAIGMVEEAKIGEKLGVTVAGTHQKIAGLLSMYHLPVDMPEIKGMMDIIAHDKKSADNRITLALIQDVGVEKLVTLTQSQLEALL